MQPQVKHTTFQVQKVGNFQIGRQLVQSFLNIYWGYDHVLVNFFIVVLFLANISQWIFSSGTN